MKSVLVLYTDIMPYTVKCLDVFSNLFNVSLNIFINPIKDQTPFKPKENSRIKYFDNTDAELFILNLLEKDKPKFILVSGWNNKIYLKISLIARKMGIVTITGCDTFFNGSLRQVFAVITSKFYIKRHFEVIFVPGLKQYEYARLLGFERKNIIAPYYSADLNLFNSFYKEFIDVKSIKYPRNLLFVGRLEEIKGVRQLIRSFNSIDNTNGWKLTIVGRGSLKNELVTTSSFNNRIKFVDFQNQDDFGNVILNCGFFVLPSISEPWGVVVHEFAASGLPLLLSNQVEAGSAFLRTGYNGFSFNHALKNDLTDKLKIIFNMTDSELLRYSKNSFEISKTYSPEMFASALGQFL
jgi:glycosyltransferase involved in cell wall biosynthesis